MDAEFHGKRFVGTSEGHGGQMPKTLKYPAVERGPTLEGDTILVPVMIGGARHKLYVTVNSLYPRNHPEYRQRPIEVFGCTGKAGSDIRTLADCICRFISIALQTGWCPRELTEKHLLHFKSGDPIPWPAGQTMIQSVPDALGKVLSHWMGDEDDEECEDS
jgi:hypothetical protein